MFADRHLELRTLASRQIDQDIESVISSLRSKKYSDVPLEQFREDARPEIALHYGASENSSWEEIRGTALAGWEWAIEMGMQSGWEFERVHEAVRRAEGTDLNRAIGLEPTAGVEVRLTYSLSQLEVAEAKVDQNERVIEETGAWLAEFKSETAGLLELDQGTPFFEVIEAYDRRFETEVARQVVDSLRPVLVERGLISAEAEFEAVRAKAIDLFRELEV